MQGGGESCTATLKQYQAKAEFFLCASLQKNNGYNVAMTPGSLHSSSYGYQKNLLFANGSSLAH